jgi:polyhydroxyalkanoate synthesis regulator phasin
MYKDPTEDYETELSVEDTFWNNQDYQTDESKEYVKELENKIREAKNDLKFIYDLAKQTNLTYIENKVNSIINKLKR